MSLRPPSGISTPAGPLDSVLDQHRLWLESQGREGARAALPVCDLRQADLRDRDLRQADLALANLAGADLSRAKLRGANLLAASFRHAILCDANLSDFEAKVDGQHPGQAGIPLSVPTVLEGTDFGGADLTIAKFPRRYGFTTQIQEKLNAARRARLLAICLGILLVVVLFQIGAARDGRLLLPEHATAGIAVVNALTGKYVFLGAGVLLVIAYGFWIIGPLRKLCSARNQLPARLPDGAAVDANRALWPLNMLAANWMPLLRDDRLDWRGRLPVWLTLAALFAVPPMVIVLVWWRMLAIHEWWSSALLAALAAAAIGAACLGWGKSAQALNGGALAGEGDERPPGRTRPVVGAAAASLLSAGALLGLSYGVIEANFSPYIAARADIAFRSFSNDPSQLVEASIAAVQGPNLAGRNLRHARIAYSGLVNADLRNARLDHAAITVSDLRRADLSGADLRTATLFASNLESAILTGADLRGATLQCAVGLNGSQLAATRTDETTILPDGSTGPYRLGSTALAVKAEACAHWAPGSGPPLVGFEIPQPLSPPPSTIPRAGELSPDPGKTKTSAEPDLSPIEELKPSRKAAGAETKQ